MYPPFIACLNMKCYWLILLFVAHAYCPIRFFSSQGNEKRIYEFIVRHFLACLSQVTSVNQQNLCMYLQMAPSGP